MARQEPRSARVQSLNDRRCDDPCEKGDPVRHGTDTSPQGTLASKLLKVAHDPNTGASRHVSPDGKPYEV
jgi:hypothetical protein